MKKIIRKTSDAKSREFWNSIHETAQEVASWPEWKRGGSTLRVRTSGLVKVARSPKAKASSKSSREKAARAVR